MKRMNWTKSFVQAQILVQSFLKRQISCNRSFFSCIHGLGNQPNLSGLFGNVSTWFAGLPQGKAQGSGGGQLLSSVISHRLSGGCTYIYTWQKLSLENFRFCITLPTKGQGCMDSFTSKCAKYGLSANGELVLPARATPSPKRAPFPIFLQMGFLQGSP